MTTEPERCGFDSFDADQTVCETESTREILSAYLDGELDDSTRRELETRLLNETDLHDELVALERTWNLLDALESEEVEESFAQSTMEMVALSASQELELQQSQSVREKRLRRLAIGSTLVATAALGFILVAFFFPRRNDPLLEDMPILLHLDAYCLIDDVAFLELLREEELFSEKSSNSTNSSLPTPSTTPATLGTDVEVSTIATSNVSSASTTSNDPFRDVTFRSISSRTPKDQRRSWIETLPDDGKYELHRSYQRFIGMSEDEQKGLREVQRSIEKSPDSEELLAIMLRYHDWVNSLTKLGMSGERSQLSRLPVEERVEKIREIQQRQSANEAAASWWDPRKYFHLPEPLANEDAAIISPLLLALADDLIVQLKWRYSQEESDWTESENLRNRSSVNDDFRTLMSLQFWFRRAKSQPSLDSPLLSEELEAIRDILSPEAQEFLLNCSDEMEQWSCLTDVVMQARIFQMYDRMHKDFNYAELAEYLENEMNPEDRERLLSLPSTDMMYDMLFGMYSGMSARQGGPLPPGMNPGVFRGAPRNPNGNASGGAGAPPGGMNGQGGGPNPGAFNGARPRIERPSGDFGERENVPTPPVPSSGRPVPPNAEADPLTP